MDLILIKNANIYSEKEIYKSNIVIEGNSIKDITDEIPDFNYKTVINAENKILLPGLVNMHMHLYSTFARGIPLPNYNPKNFSDILDQLWWKVDKLLTEEDIYYSALIPLMEGIKRGTTTVFDHHSSPLAIKNSLKITEKAFDKLNVRGGLSFEISDRDNFDQEELEENLDFINSLSTRLDRRLTGHIGLHASFTLEDDTLKKVEESLKQMQNQFGIHMHAAEDKFDSDFTQEKFGMSIMDRLMNFNLLNDKSLLAHCIHLNDTDLHIIKESGAAIIHNPRSNANNAVGTMDLKKYLDLGLKIGIGTDGMDNNMINEANFGYKMQKIKSKNPLFGMNEYRELLLKINYDIANSLGGWNIGEISQGAAADIVLADYNSPTPITKDNLWTHMLFGWDNFDVDTVIINGEITYFNKEFTRIDEKSVYSEARKSAANLWKRLNG